MSNARYAAPEIRTIQCQDIVERLGPVATGSLAPGISGGTPGGLATQGNRPKP
jgi:hypothetical protein